MDSFFGFDTSLPPVDKKAGTSGNGARNEDSEDEYDALNDETFGEPDKGDWENMHETLVRLEKGSDLLSSGALENGREELFDDDELDLHLSRFDFGDGDESMSSIADLSLDDDISSRLRLDPSIWDSPVDKPPVPQSNQGIQNLFPIQPPSLPTQNGFGESFRASITAPKVPPIRMLSVEDIERNIIQQQQQLKKQQQKISLENNKNKSARKPLPIPMVNPPIQPMVPHAQLMAMRNPMFPAPPLLNPQARLPIGFVPYNFLPHYSTPINNLAMHPGFPAALGQQFNLYPPQRFPIPIQPNLVQNVQNNQFNKRLVQEIQQNHPMLSFNRQSYNHHSNQKIYSHNNQQRYYNQQKGPDYDDYSNLMSNREKQWLIGIQLTQLNSDTPYINDYYFTVFKERLAALKGNGESKAYKDNQLNHPFTQPKGHAQLLLMSSLAKNCGMLNSKGGLNRERKISESKNNNDQKEQQQPRTYTPLQFENSLGKLQCGSVTAPRKIIDMDVVGSEPTLQSNASLELSMQRKSRHVLLHIETLFKVVLKMEDLNNPVAIEAALVAKEKRDKERQQDESVNSSISSTLEPESFDELYATLTAGLLQEKVIPMLGVRKGKILLRRILVVLREHSYRWKLWANIFSSIPFMLKKDRDDGEGLLFALYTEFERHVQYSQFLDLLKLVQVIATEKVLSHITSCKFLLSSVITVMFQMEVFFVKSLDTISSGEQLQWKELLHLITRVSSKLIEKSIPSLQHTIKIDRENNIIRTIQAHFERFPLLTKGNDFINFITVEASIVCDNDDQSTVQLDGNK